MTRQTKEQKEKLTHEERLKRIEHKYTKILKVLHNIYELIKMVEKKHDLLKKVIDSKIPKKKRN